MLIFTNTLTRTREEFIPLHPGKVTMYTCGPTVYNYAHIGNFRAVIAYDIIKKWLQCHEYDVTHVMNITDVDDKTIRGAREDGTSLTTFTQKYTDAFWEDCDALRIARPEIQPKATENIDAMITHIATLMEKGHAYQGKDGSVYFSIDSFPDYGCLAHLQKDTLRSGARVTADEYAKDNVSDFALWKAWTEDDGDVAWESPWGRGRPGWHIECSAMSQRFLGDTIDIHMGGEDLVFPHHENEIAQSEAATGKPFARYWLHNAYLLVDGAKMAKSAGNFYTLRDILAKGYSGREIRYLLLSVHYRQPLNFTFDGLHAARSAIARLDELRTRLNECITQSESTSSEKPSPEMSQLCDQATSTWTAAMDDDVNTSAALGTLFDTVRSLNRMLDKGISAADAHCALKYLDFADKVLCVAPAASESENTIPSDILALLEERTRARQDKDFARADAARDALKDKGYTVEDTPHGPRVKRL